MKATGIVRRIDDLGRVVIPKEIRRNLRIREGDPLEIFVQREGEVILKKYSPINELGHFAEMYAEAIFDVVHLPVFITDRDEVIAVSGRAKKGYLQAPIGLHIEEAITDRKSSLEETMESLEIIRGKEEAVSNYAISTIVANGDPIGSVLMIAADDVKVTEAEQKVVAAAASFLGKQME
ncbi:MAG TPA: stage V sporulation protein T [Candidatus Pseudogracilibacillus intestinigallinarum]|uniref:Stage V sporulation protein T n=1 Tax=Candidatus Pseudogracilibacillus intestinigallinarum TaxID=2838742 RepID=A0A9D1PLI3_9BACI|nr:stage V sporulation protein T [Candidatus Pseudogracilibacillus intestinigallinarum]